MADRGRPSTYSADVASEICSRLAEGESLRAICRSEGMPAESTVRGWVIDNVDGFSAQYARARDLGLDCMAEELLEIADTPQSGVKVKNADGRVETIEGDMIEHRRLRVDSRKWFLSKLAPKRYGDKVTQEISGPDGGPVVLWAKSE